MGTERFPVKIFFGVHSVSIAERLKQERLKTGYNQTRFGAIGGVTKKTQMLYESGERMPDAVYLRAVAGVGVDVQYVLLGVPSQNLGEVMLSDEFVSETGRERSVVLNQYSAVAEVMLPADEAALLDNYRRCPPEGKAALKATSAALAAGTAAPSKKTKQVEGSIQNFHNRVDQVAGRDVVNKGRGKK